MKKMRKKYFKRLRSMLVVIGLVIAANIAISYAGSAPSKSGITILPDSPRPTKSGITILPDSPRPTKSGITILPDSPRP